jgi:hypothetical protein
MPLSDSDLHDIFNWMDLTRLGILRSFDDMEEFKQKIYYLRGVGSSFSEAHITHQEKIEPSYNGFYQNMKIQCEKGRVIALIIAEHIMLSPYIEDGYEQSDLVEDELPGLSIHIEGPDTIRELLYVPMIEGKELVHNIFLKEQYNKKNVLPDQEILLV